MQPTKRETLFLKARPLTPKTLEQNVKRQKWRVIDGRVQPDNGDKSDSGSR